MDFFAIAGHPTKKIYRLNIEQQLQSELERQFLRQANAVVDPDLEVIPFEGGNFTPDDSEILEISPFDIPAEIYDPLQNIVGCETLPGDDETIGSVYCIFGYDGDSEKLIFQVIQKQQRLAASSWAMFLSRDTFKRMEDPGLVLGAACHAVYQGGSLKFKSMWWVKQIFDISDFYRGATDADVDRFARCETVLVDDVAELKKNTGQWARTRIAFILDSGILENYTPEQLATQAADFDVPLQLETDAGVVRLRIPLERKPLRAVLKFLEEELYIGVITGERYEANSKRKRAPMAA